MRLIEPFGAGGGPDLTARALGRELAELRGQPVTIENHPGKGSTVAAALVARAPADGQTLLVSSSAQAYSAAFRSQLPYDPLADFVAVTPLTRQPYVLVTRSLGGTTTVAELIAAAKAKPGLMQFGSSGIGTGTHIGLLKFNLWAGITARHVPAREGDAIADTLANLAAGRTDYLLAPITLSLGLIRAGRLRALAVSTTQRSPLLPGVPTIAESAPADFDFPIWYGVWAPAGTPAGVIDRLATDIGRAMAAPALCDWAAEHGAETMRMTQSEFARFVVSESESAAQLIRTTASGSQ